MSVVSKPLQIAAVASLCGFLVWSGHDVMGAWLIGAIFVIALN